MENKPTLDPQSLQQLLQKLEAAKVRKLVELAEQQVQPKALHVRSLDAFLAERSPRGLASWLRNGKHPSDN